MKKTLPILIMLLLLLPTVSCNLGTGANLGVATYAAQTIAALTTPGNSTPASTTAAPGLTEAPSLTPTLTQPPTVGPTITATAMPCNWAKFIKDVTIDDGWQTTPDDTFVKTWRLQNIGTCTWTSGYSLIFDTGDRMNAPDALPLTPGTVPPGGTIDVSVTLKSPSAVGTYQGYFELRAPNNSVFGIGASANNPFWVKIEVIAAPKPDLIVTGWLSWPSPPKAHQAFDFSVKVKNQGTGDAAAFLVYWFRLSTDPIPTTSWSVPSLAAGAEKSLGWTYGGYPAIMGGTIVKIKIVVDPLNAVPESDDGNNNFSQAFNLGLAP